MKAECASQFSVFGLMQMPFFKEITRAKDPIYLILKHAF